MESAARSNTRFGDLLGFPRFLVEVGWLGGVLAVGLDDGFAQMIGSSGLMGVGDEAAGGSGSVGGFVVSDRSGEGEESLADAGGDALGSLPAVAFEVELGFEGLIDGFDDLAERRRNRRSGRGLSPLVVGRIRVVPTLLSSVSNRADQ